MIVDLSRDRVAGPIACDVCVVGSGCGGATAALELARAGRDVVVLEEGGDFIGESLTMRDGMFDQLYMERGGRSTVDLAIAVLQGRVLGGGGVINACDVVPIHAGVNELWVKKHGLTDFSREALAPFEQEALEDLSANVPREDQINANNAALRDGARALGWRGEVMMHNRVGCAGLGKCMVGCRLNAKRNPRFVAIPRAMAAGARFYLRARAVRVEGAGAEVKRVVVRTLDGKGYHEERDLEVRAKIVVLAANAVATAQLLLRSGLGNEHVGKHLSLQPQLPIVAIFPRELRSFDGIPQSFAVTEFERSHDEEHGWWGFRLEAIGATPGLAASLLAKFGRDGKEMMHLYPRFAASLMLAPDDGNGTVTVDRKGRARISYALPDEQKRRYRDAAKAAARLYLAAGATEVVLPVARPIVVRSERELDAFDAATLEPATAPFVSAHQQGTVRFSPSASGGGADPAGQVYGTRGVYVLDSSGYPSSASSHTMTPILTTARALARRMV